MKITHTFNKLNYLLLATLLMLPCSLHASRDADKLTGTPIGSQPVNYGSGLQYADYAFDGDFSTYYASDARSYSWVGLDLGTEHVITQIGFCPRNGYAKRTLLGVFEGSNRADFLDAVPLYIIPEVPAEGAMTYVKTNVSRGFRYVRYVGPSDVRCNIAELEFYGTPGVGTDETFYQLTNLPTVSIHTYSGAEVTSKDYELEANVTITYDGCRIQEYPILVKGRGNASWSFPKKPMRIKFNDGKSHHVLKDSPLESPAKAKKWTLINNYGDKTLMRNIVAFEMSRRLGMPYTPYCQPVDVLLNGEYKGCYQLCDQISADPARVPITELTPEDNTEPAVTGGYLLEIDAYAESETSWFRSSQGMPVTIKSPDADEITGAQRNYIRSYFNTMEQRLWASNYTDETAGYRSILDVESFLKHFIVGEFSGNTDTYWSTYLYKNREDDIFHISPVWDFDLAFENDSRTYPINNRADWVFRTGGSYANRMNEFVNRVLSDPYADKWLRNTWSSMRKSGAFGKTELLAFVDSMAQVLDASQKLNFTRWPILNEAVHLNNTPMGSYEGEVAVLRRYLDERINWIDNYFGRESPDVPTDTLYNIGTAEQLIDFARLVNAGATSSQGYLTADIDMSACNFDFVTIGTQAKPFKGVFDGQGHVISNLNISGGNNFGLFGTVTGGATIRNFVLDSSCVIQGSSYVGIVGVSSGYGEITIEKVGNEALIYGSGRNVAAIIGCNMGSTATFVIHDCYNTGNIYSQGGEGGIISGWVGDNAQITGCWNIGEAVGTDWGRDFARYGSNLMLERCYSTSGNQAKWFDESLLANGELCYLLNGGNTESVAWHQTIGEDARPVFDASHGIVYSLAPLHCNGEPYETGAGFTNNATEVQKDDHNFVDFVCTYCGAFDSNFAEKDERGYFMLATPGQLASFVKYVENSDPMACAVLTADIDFTDYPSLMLGYNNHFGGTFDGAGHAVTISIDTYVETLGFIRYLDGVVMDLTVKGDIYSSRKYAGGICGQMFGAKLLRCHSLVNIHSTVNGDGTHGGMTGITNDGNGTCEIESCLFSGSIQGDWTDCCGGFVGWATNQVYIQNSLMIGDISVGSNGSDIYCRNSGNMFGSNNYYYTSWRPATYPGRDCYETSPSDMADGTLLAQLLSGAENWKQDIPADAFPLPYIEHPVLQTIELAAGWNWMSHSMAEAVPVDKVKESADIIRGQREELFLDSQMGWVGTITELAPAVGYKVYAETSASLGLTGNAYDIKTPVVLSRGWNWVGMPLTDASPVVSALNGYVPAEGDRLVGFDGFVTYTGGHWKGSLSSVSPGQAYMFFCQQPQQFCWNGEVAQQQSIRRSASLSDEVPVPWNMNKHAYQCVMNMIATVDAPDCEGMFVGAFVGDECRGFGKVEGGLCYLTIYGDGMGREPIAYRVLTSSGQEIPADQRTDFVSLALVGSEQSPFVLTLDAVTGISSAKEGGVETSYYGVDGIRLTKPQKGVYIRVSETQNGGMQIRKETRK